MDIDWKKIKEEYISTPITLDALAKKHKIPKSTLYKKSSAGKWNSKKKEFGKKVEEKFVEKASGKIATQDINKLERLIKAADRMSEVIEEAMEDPDQFKRYVVTKKVRKASGSEVMQAEERVFDKFDSRAIRDMTLAMKELTGVVRSLNGIPEPEVEKPTNQITVTFGKFKKFGV